MIYRCARAVDEIVHRMAKVAMVSFYPKRRTSFPYVFCRFDVLATQSADGILGYSIQMLLASMNMMMTTAEARQVGAFILDKGNFDLFMRERRVHLIQPLVLDGGGMEWRMRAFHVAGVIALLGWVFAKLSLVWLSANSLPDRRQ